MKEPIYKSLTFWTLAVGLVLFVVTFYAPTFPLSAENVLGLVLFVLGLVGVYPQIVKGAAPMVHKQSAGDIVHSLAFWQLVAGFVVFVITYFAPTFPFGNDVVLGVILFVLSFFGVQPELRARLK